MTTTFPTTITATTPSATTPAATTTRRGSLWRAGAASGIVAAVATTATVVIARAVDVAVSVGGERIPLAGFAQLTLVGMLVGVVLATMLSRRARHPRRAFTITTVVLTALSLVPDLAVDTAMSTRVVLMLTHAIAAAIVIPSLAARLCD